MINYIVYGFYFNQFQDEEADWHSFFSFISSSFFSLGLTSS